jgi:WD40 repeat protein
VESGSQISRVAVSPDSKLLALGYRTGEVKLCEVEPGKARYTLAATPGKPDTTTTSYVDRLLFRPDSKTLVARRSSGTLESWDTTTGETTWRQHGCLSTAFVPDGKSFLSIVRHKGLIMFAESSGLELRRAPYGVTEDAELLVVHPDGRRFLVATRDRQLRFCDIATFTELARVEAVEEHSDPRAKTLPFYNVIQSLAFSRDGKWFVTGGEDTTVRLWEVATRSEVRRFHGHTKGVLSVGFGPNSRTILSTGEDGAAYQWNAVPTNAKRSTTLWEDLASKPERAYQAIWTLADDPVTAVKLLRAKITPAQGVSADQIAKFIQQLDAPRFAEREAAMKTLTEMEQQSLPALKDAQKKGTSPEIRERAGKILERYTIDPTGENLRRSRAIQALELAGTNDAKELLREWAKGASGARLTEEAKAALGRLEAK